MCVDRAIMHLFLLILIHRSCVAWFCLGAGALIMLLCIDLADSVSFWC